MEDFTQKLITDFSRFLSQHKDKRHANPLMSFAYQIKTSLSGENFDQLIKYFSRSFYFEKPKEETSITCLNEAIAFHENGEKRFSSIEKKMKELKDNFIHNWMESFPLLVGGMKFNVEHAEEVWGDFPDSLWFIPELIFYKKKDKNYLLFNFIYNTADENIIEKLKVRLDLLFNNEIKNNKNKISFIKNLSGNSPKDRKKWKGLINSALEKVSGQEIQKIVLARRLDIILSEEINFRYVIEKLKGKYPECYIFIFHSEKSFFFGATPEKLAKLEDGKIELEALAGSAPRGKSGDEDKALEKQLLQNKKDLEEHKFVVDYLKNSLSKFSKNITCSDSVEIKKFDNIQHLLTKISAEIENELPVFNILKEIFPSPAVCGVPKESTLNLIKKLENFNRGLYSGIIGWTNLSNEGEFVVGIRSALTFNNKMFSFAGCGIVNNSNPDLEFDEAELKFRAILSLFDENK
jgi:menaquinone-specific isochorismate synthase